MRTADYQAIVREVFKRMGGAAMDAQGKIAELDAREAAAGRSLQEGIIGKAGFDQIKRQCDEGREKARAGLERAVSDGLAEVDSTASTCFTPTAADLDADVLALIGHVDLTEAEIRGMVRGAKARSYTTARALYAEAARRGIDLHDDTPAYAAQVRETMRDFSRYCTAMPTDKGFQKSWGAVVEKFGNILNGLGGAYLARDGFAGDEAKAHAGDAIEPQSAGVMGIMASAAQTGSDGASDGE